MVLAVRPGVGRPHFLDRVEGQTEQDANGANHDQQLKESAPSPWANDASNLAERRTARTAGDIGKCITDSGR